jgi:AAA15 family ATPase/GTPase
MIVDFSVENFRSIKTEQTLSMFVSDSKKDLPENTFPLEKENKLSLLKTGLIYGANASGKSNLLLALKALQDFVVDSTDLKLDASIPYYQPYKLDKKYRDNPTTFGMEFVGNDGIRYRYTISFTKMEVILEELLFYPNKQEALLFRRKKGETIKFGHHAKGRKKSIEQELIGNNLFLSKAANSNHDQFKDIYLYFKNNLNFFPRGLLGTPFDTFRTFKLQKNKGNDFSNRLTNLLIAADTGIHSIEFEEESIEIPPEFLELVPEEKREEFSKNPHLPGNPVTYHNTFDGETEGESIGFQLLSEESDGTLKMYSLGGYIIPALEKGHALIIDELDRSMHPHLCEYVVKLFNNPETNPHNAQLIATTHDTTLLNSNNLRRDQIWFISKDHGASHLFSLDEFDKSEVRKNTPFDKWYLDGRFGAIPKINTNQFRIDDEKS